MESGKLSDRPLSFEGKEEEEAVQKHRAKMNAILEESVDDAVGMLRKKFPHGYSKYSDTALVFAVFWKRADLFILERKHELENQRGEEEK